MRIILILSIATFFQTFISLSSFAQQNSNAEKMTLEKAISVALENNFGIKISDQFIQIAENNNTWARAGKTPTIDLNGSFSNNLTIDNNPASFLQGTFYNGSLAASANVNWVLYNGGRIKIAKEQLNLAVSQEKLNRNTDIHSLLRTVYQQYFAVIFQQEQLEVLQSNLALSKTRLAYEQTKKEFGASNSFNLLQFETSILSDSSAIINQSQSIEVAKRNLYNSLDIVGYANYDFPDRLSITPEDIDVEKLREVLSEENYSLKTLEMVTALNQLNTQLQTAAQKPTVSVSGNLSFAENGFKFFEDDPSTGQPFPFLFSNRLGAGANANVSWNLYDGGVRKTNIENAKIQEQIDQMSFLEAQANLNNQLDILVSNYNNQKAILSLSDDLIQVAQKNLDISGERFKAGRISSIDFRNIQTQYLSAAFNKVNAIYSLILTKSEIDFLVGKFN